MESYKRCRKDIIVIKKNGAREYFSPLALIEAVNKSARRINLQLKKHQEEALVTRVEKAIRSCSSVEKKVSPRGVIILKTSYMHILVQKVLAEISPAIAIQYTSFRNYKTISPLIVENLKKRADEIIYSGDKENANKDSQLISTKKELLAGELSRSLIQFEISDEAKKAHEEGYYYEHDMSDKIYGSINCCLFDASNVLKGGFNLNGVKYTEPTSVESALRVIGDIILQASSQQYGGFTIPEIDSVVAPYIQKGLKASKEYYRKELPAIVKDEVVEELAYKYVVRALQQGFQAIETRLNTINNAK